MSIQHKIQFLANLLYHLFRKFPFWNFLALFQSYLIRWADLNKICKEICRFSGVLLTNVPTPWSLTNFITANLSRIYSNKSSPSFQKMLTILRQKSRKERDEFCCNFLLNAWGLTQSHPIRTVNGGYATDFLV